MVKAIIPILSVVLVAILLAGVEQPAAPPLSMEESADALIGSAFAETYASFAPVLAFHESYAGYLFEGTLVAIPDDLALACSAFSAELAALHVDMMSQAVRWADGPPAALVRLRIEADAFCGSFGETLERIAESGPDPDSLEQASESGFFVAAYDVSERMERAFTEVFESIENEQGRWAFSVAFTARTLLEQPSIERIGSNLTAIFYGSEDRTESPFPIPEEIAEAMAALIDLADRTLTTEESETVRTLAGVVHRYFIGEDPA